MLTELEIHPVREASLTGYGAFSYLIENGGMHSANFPLFLIKNAWRKGCSFEKEADGFGEGLGTVGGDWSGIRDSSEKATETMLAKALNFLELT